MTQVFSATISGAVALLVAGVGAFLTLAQSRRERRKLLIDIKADWALELYKTRMATYPEVHRALAPFRTLSLPLLRRARAWRSS